MYDDLQSRGRYDLDAGFRSGLLTFCKSLEKTPSKEIGRLVLFMEGHNEYSSPEIEIPSLFWALPENSRDLQAGEIIVLEDYLMEYDEDEDEEWDDEEEEEENA